MATYETFADAQTAYHANSDWDDNGGDVTKAQAFKSACRALLLHVPRQATQGKTTSIYNVEAIQAELNKVAAFLNASDNCGVEYADLRGARE